MPILIYFCGRKAYEELQKFVANKVIRCDDKGPDTRKERRVGQCSVEDVDLQRWLVAKGWAVPFEPYAKGRYKDEKADARGLRAGLWDGCFVVPRDFRYWRKSSATSLAWRASFVEMKDEAWKKVEEIKKDLGDKWEELDRQEELTPSTPKFSRRSQSDLAASLCL